MLPFLAQEHQQQVATAVDRAKQVTMTELNAIIGVSVYILYYCNNFTFIFSHKTVVGVKCFCSLLFSRQFLCTAPLFRNIYFIEQCTQKFSIIKISYTFLVLFRRNCFSAIEKLLTVKHFLLIISNVSWFTLKHFSSIILYTSWCWRIHSINDNCCCLQQQQQQGLQQLLVSSLLGTYLRF